MAPPSAAHQRILIALSTAIYNYIDNNNGSCSVLYIAPFAVFLNEDDKNYVEPDISVICNPDKLDDKGCNGAPDWVIEIVSPSSQRMDYMIKLFKYRTAGVREYWIVDSLKNRITVYNFEEDTYHPHYHILMAVPSYYFKNPDYYLKQNEWLEIWQKAKRDKNITQVDVRKVQNKNIDGISSEVLELAKYMAKSADYFNSLDVFETYYNETHKKRFMRYGGLFKESLKEFKKGNLNKYINANAIDWYFIIKYSYRSEGYEKQSIRNLTEDEKIQIINAEINNLSKEFDVEY